MSVRTAVLSNVRGQGGGIRPRFVKGLGYRSFFEDCDRVVPGGRQAVLAAIQQPELKAFFSQEFLAASWFDIFPLPLGREIAARLAGVPMPQLAREAMAFTMKRDAATVYKSILSRREGFSHGYTVTALKLANVQNPRVRFSIEPEPPASDGLELVQVRVATSWDA